MAVRLALLLLLLAPAALADAGNRFPQPVRAGDLIGRKLIGAEEAQPLLGHVEGVRRGADGTLLVQVRTWSLLPWRDRTVLVPLGDVALLGEEVALTGLGSDRLSALPTGDAGQAVPPDEQIKVGLAKPFH